MSTQYVCLSGFCGFAFWGCDCLGEVAVGLVTFGGSHMSWRVLVLL
jgi:hypothetical protein